MAAAALIRSLGIPPEPIAAALRSFKLDHHRLELVAGVNVVLIEVEVVIFGRNRGG